MISVCRTFARFASCGRAGPERRREERGKGFTVQKETIETSCGVHCCTSSCGSHHPEAHIILRRTSSCGAYHPAVHIITAHHRAATSSCGALHPAAHIILLRTSSPHIILRSTHPAEHIILRRTSSSPHIISRRTSSCGALHPAAHIKGGGLDLELEVPPHITAF
ncbi:unnamed protein product [Pleuronectes platessa]|uniref:Uncharacterized protein n=1 Tax=Pleuronectes platessa TaxID=8262 RepID=A0A9N7VIV8_PLEPL|nr:unnamed protein product [Pleuronectes platessa]